MSYTLPLQRIGKDDIAIAGGKGANLGELTAASFPVPGGFVLTTAAYAAVDILMGIPGVEFETAWMIWMEVDFDYLTVSLISQEDLIVTKLASGRPQDLIDADLLTQNIDE